MQKFLVKPILAFYSCMIMLPITIFSWQKRIRIYSISPTFAFIPLSFSNIWKLHLAFLHKYWESVLFITYQNVHYLIISMMLETTFTSDLLTSWCGIRLIISFLIVVHILLWVGLQAPNISEYKVHVKTLISYSNEA